MLIVERVSVLGLEGFAVHRKYNDPEGRFVISHISTGRKLPGRPAQISSQALQKCLQALRNKKIFRQDLEERIAELAAK